MVAEMLVDSITWIVFLMIPALLILSCALQVRRQRGEERLIRQWCDGKGYAITRMVSLDTGILESILFWGAGWFQRGMTSRRSWRLRVYDNEGGERSLVVRVHRRGQVEETWA